VSEVLKTICGVRKNKVKLGGSTYVSVWMNFSSKASAIGENETYGTRSSSELHANSFIPESKRIQRLYPVTGK
jgi:hypothetical protein